MSKEVFKDFKSTLTKALDANEAWQKSKASGSADAYIKSNQSSIITDDMFIQYGLSYTPFIDAGRGKNKSNTGGLVSGIYDWLQYKKYDISYDTDKERLGIAIAISKNIAKLGSWKFRKNEQTTVFEDILKKITPSLEKALADRQRISIEAPIIAEIQAINASK